MDEEFKRLYSPSAKECVLLEVPSMQFLMVDGKGDPNTSQEYQQAIEVLYSLAYTLKFMLKKRGGPDFKVMPLEGLWWTEGEGFDAANKDAWLWTAMIRQPDFVTAAMIEEASAQAKAKRELPALARTRFESFDEGLSAQIMHIGPYADEGPTIERLHAFIHEQGFELSGKHHEIYLGDPRRAAPEKLKTVLRQPARPAGD
jgi:hypothetical protein